MSKLDVFWLVSSGEHDDSGSASLQLVEFRRSWPDAKQRYRELLAQRSHVEIFDFEGECLLASDGGQASYAGDLPHMSAPMHAGLYRWDEASGYVKVGLPPLASFRRSAITLNDQRRGTP